MGVWVCGCVCVYVCMCVCICVGVGVCAGVCVRHANEADGVRWTQSRTLDCVPAKEKLAWATEVAACSFKHVCASPYANVAMSMLLRVC